jgi:hypothetical protein
MIPQQQKVVDKGRGDCFRACMASFFELPNDERLPDGYASLTPWQDWLAQFGMKLSWGHKAIWREGYWIASVKSKNYTDGTMHAIIMHGCKVAFDPSTKKRYRKGQDMLQGDAVAGGWWIEVVDPNLLHLFHEYKEARD